MPALPTLFLLLATLSGTPQRSGSDPRGAIQSFLLEAGGETLAVERFEGSAQRAPVGPASATGGASSAGKSSSTVTTAVSLPLVPGAGVRKVLEQAFVGGAAGTWTVRELDHQGQEVFVHELEGVRLRTLELAAFDLYGEAFPEWSTTFDVALVRLAAGSQTKIAPSSKSKRSRAGGLRVLQDGKELERVQSIEGLRFEFTPNPAGGASKVAATGSLSGPLRMRVTGNQVKPWLDRLGSTTSGLEIELLEVSSSKPSVAARIAFGSAQLIGVVRPGDANVIELEYRCMGPRLTFP